MERLRDGEGFLVVESEEVRDAKTGRESTTLMSDQNRPS